MEDCNIKTNYVYYCEADLNTDNISNISQLSDYVNSHNFGDLVAFSDYRDTETFIIGKNGELIGNPDYSYSGYLTIPYEITQHLNNTVEKYSDVEPMYIDLRYDDKFILDNINTKSCKISKNWGWKLTWYHENELIVKFPNGSEHGFNVNSTSAYKIKKWYEGSQKEQAVIKLFYEIKNDKYDEFLEKYGKNNYEWLSAKPSIPSTWSFTHGSSGGGSKDHHSNFTYHGPSSEKEKVLDSIKKFYQGFNYKLT